MVAGNEDTDGIEVPEDGLTLNGGTISSSGDSTPANVSLGSVGFSGILVDGGSALSTDATLSALSVSGATLSPAFGSSTTTPEEYLAVVANAVSQGTITATTSETTATVEYLDDSDATLTDADTMTAGLQHNLSVGSNPVKVKVTAPDTTTTKTYIVNVFRAAVPVACSAASMTNRIWTGNLTVGSSGSASSSATGYAHSPTGIASDYGSLFDTEFDLAGATYDIRSVSISVVQAVSLDDLQLRIRPALGDRASYLTFHLGSDSFAFADATNPQVTTFAWSNHGLTWADGDAVCLALTADGPEVSSVALTSAPGTDNTYAIGDAVEATVTFDAAVDITGTPELELDFDGTAKGASCATGTNTTTMACSYTVLAGEEAPNGVAIAANTLTGGTIYATGSTTITADLDHVAVAIDSNHTVDGIRPTLVTTSPDAPTTSTDGETVVLVFSEAISTVSHSDITIQANSVTAATSAASKTGTKVELTLTTALTDSTATITVALAADAVEDNAENGNLALAATGVTNAVGSTTAPTVSGVALTSDPGSDNTYAIGDSVEATVTFSEAVDITGTPQLALDFDGTAKGATCATGMNTTTMVCSYTVVENDSAPNGVAIAANTLTGGTITATGSTTAADLDHSAVAIDAGHTVDGIRPTLDVDGGTVLIFSTVALTFSEDLDQTSVPDKSQFTVKVEETVRTFTITVDSVTITNAEVYVGFSTDPSPLRPGEHLSISYTKPASNPLKDASDNEVASFTDIEVYNNLTPTAPEAPGSLAARPGASVGAMDLTWETPWHNGDEITKFQVRHEAGPSVSASTTWEDIDGSGPTTTSHTVTGLTEGTEYTFEVRAVNGLQFGFGDGDVATTTVVAEPPPPPPPVNAAPLAVDDAAETAEDTPVTIAVLANDRDGDGDALALVEASAPAHGTARLTDAGTVEYTPEPDFHGSDRFTYTVGDGSGLTAQAAVAVTVQPVNDPPQALDDAGDTPEDTPVTIAVLENDRDGDGDALALVEASAPAHGTARLTDAGAVEYTPEPDYHGSDRFTYTVGDGSGLTAQAAVAVTVQPVNDPPQAIGVIPDQTLEAGDGPALLDLRPFFEDRDGDDLGYAAVASDQAVGLSLAGATLTLTVARPGAATVTVTAQDPGGLTATQAFMVTTTDRQARGVVEDTLAALARGHLASARATLGRRVETTGQEASRVTVAGMHVPLGTGARGVAAAGQAVAERWITGLAGGMPLQSGGWTGMGAAPGAEAVGALGSHAATLGMAGGAPFGGAGPAQYGTGASPALSGVSPLGGGGQTDFLLALGSGQAGGGAAQGPRWTVWGQVDRQSFAGEQSPAARYGGDLRTTYVGVDARLRDRWLAGVAVSRSRGDGDWNVGSSTGRLSTTLTSVQPYLRWSDGGTTIWATAGGGRGSAENERVRYGRQEESDLGLRLGLVEVRRQLATVGPGVELQLRGDASWARLTTAAGDELIDALEVDVRQLRVGIDVSRPVRTAGGTLVEPFGDVHVRHDGGSGQTGAGLEVAGGLRVARGVFRVEGMGRLLALHAANGYREHGAAVTLSVGDGARQPGLTLSLAPRWGAPATASDALWQDQLFHQRAAGTPGARRDERALDTRVDYGLPLPAGGLLTPFGIYGQSPYGRRLQVGLLLSRLGRLGLEVSGERAALRHPGRDEYRMSVLGRITFGGADNASASMSAVQQ